MPDGVHPGKGPLLRSYLNFITDWTSLIEKSWPPYSAIVLDGWNERNGRVLRHKSSLPTILLNVIIKEMKFWITVGAKKLGALMLVISWLCVGHL